jgi:histone-lysine N-methyltransferase SETMAR
VLLLHDNARPHTAALTQKKLAELYWTAHEHPPYSPDLSPCDFFLFGPLKEVLGGEQFSSNQQVKQFVCSWLKTRPSFYDTGMKKLPIRWEKCIQKAGNYVEK